MVGDSGSLRRTSRGVIVRLFETFLPGYLNASYRIYAFCCDRGLMYGHGLLGIL